MGVAASLISTFLENVAGVTAIVDTNDILEDIVTRKRGNIMRVALMV